MNGNAAAHEELRHRSKITFSDGSGFEFLSESDLEKDARFRRNLLLVLALGAVAGIASLADGSSSGGSGVISGVSLGARSG